jgi:hypothetical protein
MRSATPNLDNILRAKACVRALRSTLLAPSPEALDAHLPALEAALYDLQSIQPDRSERRELEALGAELRAAGSLIRHGLEFQQGWAKLLAAAFSGYRPDGEPRPLQARGNISVRG